MVELQNAGYDVVVLDNLSNSSEKSLERIEKITGKPVKFYKKDILDREGLNEVFEKEDIDSCIHFAGLVHCPFGHSSVIGMIAGSPYTVAEEEKIIFLHRVFSSHLQE